MFQREHYAILSTFIKLTFVINASATFFRKMFVLSFLSDHFTKILLYSFKFGTQLAEEEGELGWLLSKLYSCLFCVLVCVQVSLPLGSIGLPVVCDYDIIVYIHLPL